MRGARGGVGVERTVALKLAGSPFVAYACSMPVLTQHRFSTRDYHRMAETGVLPPDASLGYEPEDKLPSYGRAGVAEVWIVNLVEQTIEVCREPPPAGYNSKTVLRGASQARPRAFPAGSVDVGELMKR